MRKNLIIIKGLPLESDDSKVIKKTLESFMERNLDLHGAGKIGDKAFTVEMEDMTDKVNVLKKQV